MVAIRLLLSSPDAVNVTDLILPSLRTHSKADIGRIVTFLNDWNVITPHWPHIADYLVDLERLSNDTTSPTRFTAALVCSKVYHFLSEDNEALRFALRAQTQFSLKANACVDLIGPQDQMYVDRIIETALDTYRELQAGQLTSKLDAEAKTALTTLVDRLFDETIESKQYKMAMCLAFDTQRLDRIEQGITLGMKNGESTILYDALSHALVDESDKSESGPLALVLRLYSTQNEPDFCQMCNAMTRLNRPDDVADLLEKLSKTSTTGLLTAMQLSFDLNSSASQQFIRACVRRLAPSSENSDSPDEASMQEGEEDGEKEEAEADASTAAPASEAAKTEEDSSEEKDSPNAKLVDILLGRSTTQLHLQFGIRNNKTDSMILKNTKEIVRNTMAHNATVIANGLMQTGTTCDDFLRDNLDWVSKATNWNKFCAVGTLGLIHKGHETQAKTVLQAYLPSATGAAGASADTMGYKEGGALYALGLIYANHGSQEIITYLMEQLTAAGNSPLRHGACLGLGLAAMGTHDKNVYYKLRDTLHSDDAVASEAAALAMGMVFVGSMGAPGEENEAYTEMCQYMSETQHDKIKRGIRTGVALLMYGKGSACDSYIDTLLGNTASVWDRMTGVWSLAMAYAGSSDEAQIKKLLSRVAVDPNYDVKRFAATAIGFVLLREPDACVDYCRLMVEHFNGNVRYGAVMAIGIACAGTGNKDAVNLLEPLLGDKEAYVRQGVLLAMSFILVQENNTLNPRVTAFRERQAKMIGEKAEDSIVKFGAIIGQGILDAGGRNVTISLVNRATQSADMRACVGMLLFQHYWYWHAIIHTLSLTFKPTALIGLNANLKMPQVSFECDSRPSQFAYVEPLTKATETNKEKVETAVLSYSKNKKSVIAKTPAGISTSAPESAKKEKESSSKADTAVTTDEEKMDVTQQSPAKSTTETPAKPTVEPNKFTISNPSRVMPQQQKHMSLSAESSLRYVPVKAVSNGGIVMLSDKKPDDEEVLVAELPGGGVPSTSGSSAAQIRKAPAPFSVSVKKYSDKN